MIREFARFIRLLEFDSSVILGQILSRLNSSISQRCRIPFIGRRSLNGSVEFIEFTDVTLDTSGVISTPNIFVHEWCTYPTMIGPTVSNCNCCAYGPITRQKGFHKRCNHERLRLKWVEGKRFALEGHLTRVCQDMRDDVVVS